MFCHSSFAPARCFFDFSKDVSHEMIGFGTIFGRGLSEMLPKPIVSRETSLKKSKKRCAIFKLLFRLGETTLCVEKSCLVYAKR